MNILCVYIYIYISLYMYMCVYIYIYTYIYIHMFFRVSHPDSVELLRLSLSLTILVVFSLPTSSSD